MANVVYLAGNLVRDVQDVRTGSGTPMAFVPLAADREYVTAGGKTRQDTAYPSVVCFGGNALYAQRHGQRGRAVLIEGALRTRKVNTEDGPRYVLEVVADTNGIRIFEGKAVSGDGTGLIPRDPAAGEVDEPAAPSGAQIA